MKSLREQAMNYLARREHSRQELLQKLRQKGHSTEEILPILEKLSDDRLQSDDRFAQHFIQARQSAGYGPRRIIEDLRQRGISESIFSDYLAEIDWFSALKNLCQRKFQGEISKDVKSLAKQQRFLQARGFSIDHIIKLTRKGELYNE
jgi:regulatory protein